MSSRRMLLVDDHEEGLRAMIEFFEAYGWSVDGASEFEEAEALVECRSYDAAICDLRLRGTLGTEGLELVRDIRHSAPTAAVVLFSGALTDDLILRARELGADSVLSKPLSLHAIAKVLETIREERDHAAH